MVYRTNVDTLQHLLHWETMQNVSNPHPKICDYLEDIWGNLITMLSKPVEERGEYAVRPCNQPWHAIP